MTAPPTIADGPSNESANSETFVQGHLSRLIDAVIGTGNAVMEWNLIKAGLARAA